MSEIEHHLTRALRKSSGRILASLIKSFGDFDKAEDALQDAAAEALRVWPTNGIPHNPAAWLHTAAKRRAIDKIRKDTRHHAKETQQILIDLEATKEDMSETDYDIPDERLRLMFTCCHPALSNEAQLALTLRTLGGLTVREIARAFLSSETAMLQRITRAKKKIRDAGIPYEVPGIEQLAGRRVAVQKTIYLIFNESYSAFEGQTLTRDDLAKEAIRLAALLFRLDPCPETGGLLCLMQFTHARRAARTDNDGQMVSLEHQDRSLWDHKTIKQTNALLVEQFKLGQFGPYQIQAAISGMHCQAQSWGATDWQQIAALYQALTAFDPSPVVQLNAAMAQANMGEVQPALASLQTLEDELCCYQPFFAARAELHLMRGDKTSALFDLDRAIDLTKNLIERRFLLDKRENVAICKSDTEN
ncbi:RNA polymerase sigma factor [Maritalea porphyrae]|uniref:RNA polymerase sigma factor n=1 Tax=Maritalea porphyrae TaxID=880732 RepID=UPI0022AE778D|nr:RNA polymerase sigma factor [Maritalea porphyrae]MCZ4273584.1 RNA polymerase sigma factor [Maritalea porphyrae]